MNLQYLSDNNGKTTGVFIPIMEWNELKKKYKDIEHFEVPDWQQKIVSERLEKYYNGSDKAIDFHSAIDDIEKDL
ncbi:MAG: hypothetical protein Kapaf2KO_07950 [Candidatus Kapaibacteriales bacterium]